MKSMSIALERVENEWTKRREDMLRTREELAAVQKNRVSRYFKLTRLVTDLDKIDNENVSVEKEIRSQGHFTQYPVVGQVSPIQPSFQKEVQSNYEPSIDFSMSGLEISSSKSGIENPEKLSPTRSVSFKTATTAKLH